MTFFAFLNNFSIFRCIKTEYTGDGVMKRQEKDLSAYVDVIRARMFFVFTNDIRK